MKIEKVETWVVNYPTEGRFKFFANPPGVGSGRRTVVIKLTSDDGQVGWGQSVPSPRWSYETIESAQTTIECYLAPLLIGSDPSDEDALWLEMNRAIAPSFSTGQPICKAGVQLAMFDLTGRAVGQSAADRWRRAVGDGVTLSWTLNPTTLDEAQLSLEEARARGYRHFNVKVAPDLKFDLELIRHVRQHSDDAVIWADANGGYDFESAARASRVFADFGLLAFEQPFPANQLADLRRLRQSGGLPIVLDEPLVSLEDLRQFHALGLLDGAAVKVPRCGGLTEARRQIEYLLEHDLMFLASGLTEPDIGLAAAVALFSAFELPNPAALNGPQFLGASILNQPLTPVGDQLAVPVGPGLGVEVDEDKLAAAASH